MLERINAIVHSDIQVKEHDKSILGIFKKVGNRPIYDWIKFG